VRWDDRSFGSSTSRKPNIRTTSGVTTRVVSKAPRNTSALAPITGQYLHGQQPTEMPSPTLTSMLPVRGRVLVTGATGFIGTHVVERLIADGWDVRAGVRAQQSVGEVKTLVLGDLRGYGPDMDFSGFDAVVHLAAKVHDMDSDDLDEYMALNYEPTVALAAAAMNSGVGHFVFLSSIKVNGEQTSRYRPFRADDPLAPADSYALSKARAEGSLHRMSEDSDRFGVTVIRPTLVYGPGVGANFARLMMLARSPVPMPAGLGVNRRSLVSVANLSSAISTVLLHPSNGFRRYLVRDGIDVSTTELVSKMRRAEGRWLPSIPVGSRVLHAAFRLSGRGALEARLLGSLTVDDSPIRRDLDWRPSQTIDEGLESAMGIEPRRRRLMLFITEDWYFWSHRLPIAQAARDHGWEVHIACAVNEFGDKIEAEGLVLHPLSLDRGSRRPGAEARALARIGALINSVRPDVLHNVALKPVLYGSLAGRATGVPVIVNALAGLGAAFTGDSRTLMAAGLTGGLQAAMRGDNQWLIVQNRDDKRFALEQGLVAPWRLRVIPGSGVDLEAFPYSLPASGDGRLLTATVVSRMLWDKGIAETVEAARLLRTWGVPIQVQLVGDPDPHNPRSIPPEQLHAWDESGVVKWLGRREDVADVWRDSDIAVLASYREGMPKSLLEAASVGRPLITTDVPGCRELVIDGVNGRIVPAKDAAALARALASLVSDPQGRLALGLKARKLTEHSHGTGTVTRAHLDLYETALGIGRRGLT
jgi:nucleoside-diphosphate-sugar epimerase/glycosyltransferase involved in cell wall biosynthesis